MNELFDEGIAGMVEIGHGAGPDDLTLVNHGDVIRDLAGRGHIVSDGQRGCAQILHALDDQFVDDVGHDGIKARRGFVKENDFRVRGNGTGEAYAFLHTARQLRREQIGHAFAEADGRVTLLTRSQRISHENLRLRDPQWLDAYERWLAERAGVPAPRAVAPRPPLLTPFSLRGLTLPNRVVVSPTLLYSAKDGLPGPFHLVHLGSRALGGAGLVLAEATAVLPEGRMTPGDTGLWNDEQTAAWKQITDFVHAQSTARVGLQLNHAGRRGSTQLGWEQPDHPLPEGNWPLVSEIGRAHV